MRQIISIVLLSTIVNIVVLKNKGHDNFIFNDNIDNVRQYYKSWVRQIISIVLLSTIVEHCRSKQQGAWYFLYLTTIVTMFDNFYNIHEYNGLSCSSDCQTLSNIVVQKNKGHDNFVLNDNSDNDWQCYKSWVQHIILHILLSTIVEHCRLKKQGAW